MFFYQHSIYEKFNEVEKYAEKIRQKYNKLSVKSLIAERNHFETLYKQLEEILPQEVVEKSNVNRHLAWMKKRLGEKKPKLCKQDIEDISFNDMKELKKQFDEWCFSDKHYDQELINKLKDLISRKEFDSTIRKAFVILTRRIIIKFKLAKDLDGENMINKLFSKKGIFSNILKEKQCLPLRNLLSGLYGHFRNMYSHHDIDAPWHEANAVISLINFILKYLDEYEIDKQGKIKIASK